MRKLFIAIVALLIIVGYFPLVALADMTDKATLGGQDTSGNYHWRVDASGDFIPGTTGQNSIGDSTHKINDLYSSGAMYFGSSMRVTGLGSGGVSSVATDTTTLTTTGYSLFTVKVATTTLTVANGQEGEIVTLLGEEGSDTGTLTISATTKTGWTSVSMDTVRDSLTLLYLNSTSGWIIIGSNSVTIT